MREAAEGGPNTVHQGGSTLPPHPALWPYQERGINAFLHAPDKRLLWAWWTGAGKTRAALELSARLGAARVLIIGPAQARPIWSREAKLWRYPEVEPIRFGSGAKSLSKKQRIQREHALESPRQVVSFELMHEAFSPVGSPPELVIIDEAHALQDPHSQQSRTVKTYVRPDVPLLLLTATPIPNEVQNIWNLMDTLSPGCLGAARKKDGGIPYSFLNQYCNRVERDWSTGSATAYVGGNPLTLPWLRKKIAPLVHCVTKEEVPSPALNARILWIDEPRKKPEAVLREWMETRAAEDATHIGVFCWLHETAAKFTEVMRRAGWAPVVIGSAHTPEQRQRMVDDYRASPRACMVGLVGSLCTAISLSCVKNSIVFEWRATPGQALQFAGRFPRPDVTISPLVEYVAFPDDEKDAEVLHTRLTTASKLFDTSTTTEALLELFAPREMTEERLDMLARTAFGHVRLSLAEDCDE